MGVPSGIEQDPMSVPTFDRVLLAIAGELEPVELTAAELPFYDYFVLQRFAHPSAADFAAMAALGQEPGAVGLDDAGNLVERGGDGLLRILANAHHMM